jgi:hypothetical protein
MFLTMPSGFEAKNGSSDLKKIPHDSTSHYVSFSKSSRNAFFYRFPMNQIMIED